MNRSSLITRAGKAVALTALLGVVAALGASAPSAWGAPATATPSWALAPVGTYHYRQVNPTRITADRLSLLSLPQGRGHSFGRGVLAPTRRYQSRG